MFSHLNKEVRILLQYYLFIIIGGLYFIFIMYYLGRSSRSESDSEAELHRKYSELQFQFKREQGFFKQVSFYSYSFHALYFSFLNGIPLQCFILNEAFRAIIRQLINRVRCSARTREVKPWRKAEEVWRFCLQTAIRKFFPYRSCEGVGKLSKSYQVFRRANF